MKSRRAIGPLTPVGDDLGTTLSSMTDPGPAPYAMLTPQGAPATRVEPAPHEVPAPPPGPGVVPPFAAPPTEGRTIRMWLGLGVGALAVLLCCGGGTAAVVGLVISGTEAINEQARAVVGDYFDAVTHKEYDKAYDLLCDQLRQRESAPEFERRVAAEPEIASYRVGETVVGTNEVTVPVDVTYSGGGQGNLRAALTQQSQTGTLKVCDVS